METQTAKINSMGSKCCMVKKPLYKSYTGKKVLLPKYFSLFNVSISTLQLFVLGKSYSAGGKKLIVTHGDMER